MTNTLLYGLNDKIKKLKNYCKCFIENGDEFKKIKEKLSISPTFLFYGLPGTGKTTTAYKIYKQLREEGSNIDFYRLRIEEITSYNFGESSKNLISFFDQIKKDIVNNDSFAFVILDEIDSVAVNRYQSDSESIKRILLTFNTIIDEMFFCGNLDRIILIATTNVKESIDTSVLRRFFFHEDFNVILNKEDFSNFIQEIISAIGCFKVLQEKYINELFLIYINKKFTLGEIKTIFAHLYMESLWSVVSDTQIINTFKNEDSFYNTIIKQKKWG